VAFPGISDLSDENIFILATCKEKGIQFLRGEARINVPYKVATQSVGSTAPVSSRPVNGQSIGARTGTLSRATGEMANNGSNSNVASRMREPDVQSGVLNSVADSQIKDAPQIIAAVALHHRFSQRRSKINLYQAANSRWRW
jgi:hypothetical protein